MWMRDDLIAQGFTGFVRFTELPTASVPADAGVYAVLRESHRPPDFRPISPAGHFKRRDPTVSMDVLSTKWVEGAFVVYIGKAGAGSRRNRGLCKRLDEYRRHGDGEPVGHWGGRFIWQLVDSGELRVGWKVTEGPYGPGVEEARLLDIFFRDHGALPFANIRRPKVLKNLTM